MSVAAIVLNGVGSVGKSLIARAMTALVPGIEVVAMDDRLARLPPESFGTPAGLTFARGMEDGAPSTAVIAGRLVGAALAEMRADIAAAVRAGRRIIVDDVILGRDDDREYRRLMPGVVALVAVRAPLAVVEERERVRGDRTPGLARWQFDRVHAGRSYDLEIDTTLATPEESAAEILRAFHWLPVPERRTPD